MASVAGSSTSPAGLELSVVTGHAILANNCAGLLGARKPALVRGDEISAGRRQHYENSDHRFTEASICATGRNYIHRAMDGNGYVGDPAVSVIYCAQMARIFMNLLTVGLGLILLSGALAAATADLRLIDAAKNKDAKAVRELLAQHVPVTATAPDGSTALH